MGNLKGPSFSSYTSTKNKASNELSLSMVFHGKATEASSSKKPCLANKVSTELLLFDPSWFGENRGAIFTEEKSSLNAPQELVLFGKTLTKHYLGDKASNELVPFGQPCETSDETEKESTSSIFQEDKGSWLSSTSGSVPMELALFDQSCTTIQREISAQSVSMWNTSDGPWKLRKQLTSSDVGNQCRLLLETSFVRRHVFTSMSEEEIALVNSKTGAKVKVWDEDTKTEYELVLRLWQSSMSYVLVHTWKADFVKRRCLRKGDEVGIYWDSSKTRFCFSVLRRTDQFVDGEKEGSPEVVWVFF